MKVYGSDFFWNIKSLNPYRNLIPEDLDLVVVHNPPKGFNDGGGSGFGGSGGFRLSRNEEESGICAPAFVRERTYPCRRRWRAL